MIRTEGLTKKYGNFTAVDNVNLNIAPGEIYGFLGPNGAGKTSTIMMLLGILQPTEGKIFLFDEQCGPNRLDLRKRIGMVPEKHPSGMWNWMTALEYLELFAELYSIANAMKRIVHLLEEVDLVGVKDKRVGQFSLGMLQKLSISRALLHDPDILFLDEPISGLDPIGIKQVRDLILSENRRNRTIFVSSHMLSEMEKICHRVAIIHEGKLVAEDTMDALVEKLTENREILIDVENDLEIAISDIKSLDFVLDCYRDEKTLVAKVPKKGDFRKEIAALLIKRNIVPLSVREKGLSLEEAFVAITKKNIDMLTEPGAPQ